MSSSWPSPAMSFRCVLWAEINILVEVVVSPKHPFDRHTQYFVPYPDLNSRCESSLQPSPSTLNQLYSGCVVKEVLSRVIYYWDRGSGVGNKLWQGLMRYSGESEKISPDQKAGYTLGESEISRQWGQVVKMHWEAPDLLVDSFQWLLTEELPPEPSQALASEELGGRHFTLSILLSVHKAKEATKSVSRINQSSAVNIAHCNPIPPGQVSTDADWIRSRSIFENRFQVKLINAGPGLKLECLW